MLVRLKHRIGLPERSMTISLVVPNTIYSLSSFLVLTTHPHLYSRLYRRLYQPLLLTTSTTESYSPPSRHRNNRYRRRFIDRRSSRVGRPAAISSLLCLSISFILTQVSLFST